MRKLCLILTSIVLCLFVSQSASAKGINRMIGDGYTPDGHYYTIQEVQTSVAPNNIMSSKAFALPGKATAPQSMFITRNIHMDRSYFPPETLTIVEVHYGIGYRGTLRRIAVVSNETVFYGVYEGYLYQL